MHDDRKHAKIGHAANTKVAQAASGHLLFLASAINCGARYSPAGSICRADDELIPDLHISTGHELSRCRRFHILAALSAVPLFALLDIIRDSILARTAPKPHTDGHTFYRIPFRLTSEVISQ